MGSIQLWNQIKTLAYHHSNMGNQFARFINRYSAYLAYWNRYCESHPLRRWADGGVFIKKPITRTKRSVACFDWLGRGEARKGNSGGWIWNLDGITKVWFRSYFDGHSVQGPVDDKTGYPANTTGWDHSNNKSENKANHSWQKQYFFELAGASANVVNVENTTNGMTGESRWKYDIAFGSG